MVFNKRHTTMAGILVNARQQHLKLITNPESTYSPVKHIFGQGLQTTTLQPHSSLKPRLEGILQKRPLGINSRGTIMIHSSEDLVAVQINTLLALQMFGRI
ncbi:hypothetical protein EVAR_73201_1 [Eumeta japonica]|uniref:Uncharacterized protein n=1 Tax=Eumeta variegata TaxID=151549 RepID=A0A4C1SWU7_EUMVA|nr:hypothetical protein EVAR_73201_1 [Eumeta japonica]